MRSFVLTDMGCGARVGLCPPSTASVTRSDVGSWGRASTVNGLSARLAPSRRMSTGYLRRSGLAVAAGAARLRVRHRPSPRRPTRDRCGPRTPASRRRVTRALPAVVDTIGQHRQDARRHPRVRITEQANQYQCPHRRVLPHSGSRLAWALPARSGSIKATTEKVHLILPRKRLSILTSTANEELLWILSAEAGR